MEKSYWLLKTEPETYSFDQLLKDKKTPWNGVRNFQARNFLNEMAADDVALIYHSGKERAIVGLARVVRTAYPDPDPKKSGDWVQVDLVPLHAFAKPVSLSEIKTQASLSDLKLLKQSRLSVMPVSPKHFKILLKLGGES
jgi:predicted RNA-binding protein with PUA-like domain